MSEPTRREIYLDYMASTPCDPTVVEAMLPFLVYEFANPSSSHRAGTRARVAIEGAREQSASVLGCLSDELVFTGGATESNNLAILGCARVSDPRRRKIVTTRIEHKSVLGPCEYLSERGFKVALCPVRSDGRIDLGALSDLLDDETLLVSVQIANNEIGTIQPLLEVTQLAHRVGARVHSDVAQGFGKIPIDLEDLDLDYASISSHKCYGPKGIGALYVRDGPRNGYIAPILWGGGQEGMLRPGTPNVAGVVGFGVAARLAAERMASDSRRIGRMRDRLEDVILENVDGVRKNGAIVRRLAGASSLSFEGIDADAIIASTPELALSSSSACNAGAPEPSHVLQAIGLTREQAYATLRIGLGRFTLPFEVEYAATRIVEVVRKIGSV